MRGREVKCQGPAESLKGALWWGGTGCCPPSPCVPWCAPLPPSRLWGSLGEIWDGGHVAALTPVWERATAKQVGGWIQPCWEAMAKPGLSPSQPKTGEEDTTPRGWAPWHLPKQCGGARPPASSRCPQGGGSLWPEGGRGAPGGALPAGWALPPAGSWGWAGARLGSVKSEARAVPGHVPALFIPSAYYFVQLFIPGCLFLTVAVFI